MHDAKVEVVNEVVSSRNPINGAIAFISIILASVLLMPVLSGCSVV